VVADTARRKDLPSMLVTHGSRPRHSLRERRPRELKTGAHGITSVTSEPGGGSASRRWR
jgi:hypothetical protein